MNDTVLQVVAVEYGISPKDSIAKVKAFVASQAAPSASPASEAKDVAVTLTVDEHQKVHLKVDAAA